MGLREAGDGKRNRVQLGYRWGAWVGGGATGWEEEEQRVWGHDEKLIWGKLDSSFLWEVRMEVPAGDREQGLLGTALWEWPSLSGRSTYGGSEAGRDQPLKHQSWVGRAACSRADGDQGGCCP